MNNSKSVICWLILRIFYPFIVSFKAITGKKKLPLHWIVIEYWSFSREEQASKWIVFLRIQQKMDQSVSFSGFLWSCHWARGTRWWHHCFYGTLIFSDVWVCWCVTSSFKNHWTETQKYIFIDVLKVCVQIHRETIKFCTKYLIMIKTYYYY